MAPPIDFNPSDFANTMAVTALVTLGTTPQSSGTLTAYVGTAVRGLQDTPSSPPFGPYAGKALFQITTYADSAGGGEAAEAGGGEAADTHEQPGALQSGQLGRKEPQLELK